MFIDKTVRLNNVKTRASMNAKISASVIFLEAIIYLLLYNLCDFTFKFPEQLVNKTSNLIIHVWQKFL